MKILKFGGTSLGSPERIQNVGEIIAAAQKRNRIAVVVSAMAGVTNQLIDMALLAKASDKKYRDILQKVKKRHVDAVRGLFPLSRQGRVLASLKMTFDELREVLHGIFLVKELTPRTLDYMMSFGERLSAYMVSELLKKNKISAEFLDARLMVKTDDYFGAARVKKRETYAGIKNHFKKHKPLQVITGFLGSTNKGETTTLGRSGSDYTASLFGAALGVEAVEIWTDVDGVMTADPRKVPKAYSLQRISYKEAMEMSHFGAKVIHPFSMQPLIELGIPLTIKNTMNSDFPGTIIAPKSKNDRSIITGISSIDSISLLTLEGSGMMGIPGISKRLFGALSEEKINVILISQASSEHSICFAVIPEQAQIAKKAIETEFSLEMKVRQINNVVVENDLCIIAVVGEQMQKKSGISGRLFSSLGKKDISIVAIAQGSSERNISFIVTKDQEARALNAIHEKFFFGDRRPLHVFLVGTGLIGSTLLQQIQSQYEYLARVYRIDIKVIGLGNSKTMLCDSRGIDLRSWKKDLMRSKEKMSFKKYIEHMCTLDLENSVFVDCTANDSICNFYEDILSSRISVVTPNKKANSSSFRLYQKLQQTADLQNTSFLYETNVGAGLPIISILRDLTKSGDTILKIEGVFSGTLSYIFNSFDGTKKFSQVVKEAQENGYTEPDPRDDLSGMDVARKILILAREVGLPLELRDIQVQDLVPQKAKKIKSISAFFSELKKQDAQFLQKLQKARKKKCVLRYVATLNNGKAKVSLAEIAKNHPCYSLSGSENIISFTTHRYKDIPLVVKGPGAGAEVTAAGVFADIIRTA